MFRHEARVMAVEVDWSWKVEVFFSGSSLFVGVCVFFQLGSLVGLALVGNMLKTGFLGVAFPRGEVETKRCCNGGT